MPTATNLMGTYVAAGSGGGEANLNQARKPNVAGLAIMPVCLSIVLCLTLSATLSAQTTTPTPTLGASLNPAFFAVPAGMKVTCAVSATDAALSRTCPVTNYRGITTLAYGFDDNRVSLGIVSYDRSGKIFNNVTMDGARNVYKVTSDTEAKTVTFWGEGDAKIALPWSSLGPVTASTQTPALSTTLNPAFFAVPAGMKVTCAVSATDETISRTCPWINYTGITTRAYGFDDDRVGLGIVSYDRLGKIVNNVTVDGARNLYKITSDTEAKTVAFWGEGDAKIDRSWLSVGPPTVYKWVTQAAPPAKAVTAPDAPNKAVCRGLGQYGRPWAGYWDGTQCLGVHSGATMPVLTDLQFLVLVSGSVQWRSGEPKIIPSDIGALPGNTINAGNTYFGTPQILCSQGGYVGRVYQNSCQISPPNPRLSGQQNATVLVGRVE